jgi:hypothetical protein
MRVTNLSSESHGLRSSALPPFSKSTARDEDTSRLSTYIVEAVHSRLVKCKLEAFDPHRYGNGPFVQIGLKGSK